MGVLVVFPFDISDLKTIKTIRSEKSEPRTGSLLQDSSGKVTPQRARW